jgi:hypothetical protein
MPDKSRRSRRNISSKLKTDTVLKDQGSLIAGNSIKTAAIVQGRISSANNQKSADIGYSGPAYLFSELKWIGVVTAIIIILMVITYFIFR